MIVRPLHERRRARPVGFIVDASSGMVMLATPDGVATVSLDSLRRFDGYLYALCRPSRLLSATDARHWTGYSWSGAINKLVLDNGPTVFPFFSAVKGLPTDVAVEEGYRLFAWLLRRGVIPGSLSSMTMRLWRTTLDSPLHLSRRRLLGSRALYGGRQEAPYPGDFRDCKYFDMTAAYPTSMAAAPYPTQFRSVGSHLGDGSGIARATVLIPEMEWSPLPVRMHRNALCYGWGVAAGFWPWSDLRLAKDTGCTVEIHESWQGVDECDMFADWWDIVLEGREHVPLSKAVTSRLWGAFSLSQSSGYRIRWTDADGKKKVKTRLQERTRGIPTAPYISAETTARVRNRLYREALAGCDDVIYVDTDAVITGGKLPPENVGMAPGQWRVKASMSRCEIRGPQCFRHECATCNRDHARWHYVVAGASSTELAQRMFNFTGRHNGIAWTPGQMTLPKGPLERYANELSTARTNPDAIGLYRPLSVRVAWRT